MSKGPSLVNDRDHFKVCHRRWSRVLNRDQDDPGYRDEWYAEQCFACRFYIPLVGAFMADYGVCSHPESRFDGRVMFEHDGCEHFSQADEQWTPGSDTGSFREAK